MINTLNDDQIYHGRSLSVSNNMIFINISSLMHKIEFLFLVHHVLLKKSTQKKFKQPKNLQKSLQLEYYISTHHNKFHSQIVIILLLIKLNIKKLSLKFQNLYKILVIAIIDLTVWIESKIHNVQTLIHTSSSKYPLSCIL